MALPALGLDPWSLLGLFLFQLLLLLLPPSPAGAGGQGPVPRLRYYSGKCLMARKYGDVISRGVWRKERGMVGGDKNRRGEVERYARERGSQTEIQPERIDRSEGPNHVGQRLSTERRGARATSPSGSPKLLIFISLLKCH